MGYAGGLPSVKVAKQAEGSSASKGRGKKKNCEKAVRLTALGGEGGSPPLSLTTSICENFEPFLSFIKRQNNPKYGNLSRKSIPWWYPNRNGPS